MKREREPGWGELFEQADARRGKTPLSSIELLEHQAEREQAIVDLYEREQRYVYYIVGFFIVCSIIGALL